MYTICAKPENHRVEVTFEGPHDYDHVAFSAELREAVLSIRSSDGHFDLLVDFSKGQVLPQEIAHRSEQNIAWCLSQGMRKSANVMPTTTHRMQVKRLSNQDERLGYFPSRPLAESWLES
ncbi:MAG: hypothetical protein AAGK17_11930 [Pseudomonadota bacterium]